MPGILERFDLAVGRRAGRRLEQDVVVGVRVERRVEIDEIDALVGDMLAQHLEIVTVEKLIARSHAKRPPAGGLGAAIA